jgi:hypothetical protein
VTVWKALGVLSGIFQCKIPKNGTSSILAN